MRIPTELADFSVWLNPTNLKAFNKIELIRLIYKAFNNTSSCIPKSVQSQLSTSLKNNELDRGIFSLRLYFYQIIKGKNFCLDLRASHFFYKDHWNYNGKKIAHQFSQDFILGLSNTYCSYYSEDRSSLGDSLNQMGLIHKSWSADTKDELERIFSSHFNSADSCSQIFQLSELIKSFEVIFLFIKNNGGKVPSEFGLLGIYLTSLYLNLDRLGQKINVKDCYLFASELVANNKEGSR